MGQQQQGPEAPATAAGLITSARRRIKKDSAAPAVSSAAPQTRSKPQSPQPAAKRPRRGSPARSHTGEARHPAGKESAVSGPTTPAEAPSSPASTADSADDAENTQPPAPPLALQPEEQAQEPLMLEHGAGGVPGKAGAPGAADPAGCREASGVSTDTSVDDRVLCPLPAKCALASAVGSPGMGDAESNEAELDVVAFEEEDLDGEEENFDPYAFIKTLPPLSQCTAPWRHQLLPRQTRTSKRRTLVLDLDETLVHSSLEDPVGQPDFSFTVTFNGRDHCVQVRRRPHLQEFLERCAALFEVVVFTASQKVYAEQLLNVLDPTRRLIRHRIFRDSCVFVDGNYLKDLSVLGRDLAHTIIIDNSPQAFGFQLRNGIPIESWYSDDSDRELLELLPFLERCAQADDVRPLIHSQFKLEQVVANAHGTMHFSRA